jgi:hyaluronoglucosaminidase
MWGVIEGFYGRPWSHAARLRMIRFLGELGLDTYVHAPKDDPHHRSRWWEPYDPAELSDFQELIAVGRDCGVRIVVATAPAKLFGTRNVRPGSREEALHAKIGALQGIGCRDFALLFDDTAATFVPSAASTRLGRSHADVATRALQGARRTDPGARMFVVPAVYHGTWDTMSGGARRYWRGLSELDPEVPVAWTGPRIFSRSIKGADASRLARESGRSLVIWNNVIANDWLPLATRRVPGLGGAEGLRKLCFGPVDNMDADLPSVVHGVLLNGALEPELTRIATAEMAADLRSAGAPLGPDPGAAHDPEQASIRAATRVVGADAALLLERLQRTVQRHIWSAPHREEIPELAAAARRYIAVRGRPDARLEAAAALTRQLEPLEQLEQRCRGLEGDPVWPEIAPSLRVLALSCRAALRAIERDEARAAGRNADARRLDQQRRGLLKEARGVGVVVARLALGALRRL